MPFPLFPLDRRRRNGALGKNPCGLFGDDGDLFPPAHLYAIMGLRRAYSIPKCKSAVMKAAAASICFFSLFPLFARLPS